MISSNSRVAFMTKVRVSHTLHSKLIQWKQLFMPDRAWELILRQLRHRNCSLVPRSAKILGSTQAICLRGETIANKRRAIRENKCPAEQDGDCLHVVRLDIGQVVPVGNTNFAGQGAVNDKQSGIRGKDMTQSSPWHRRTELAVMRETRRI